MIIWAPKAGDRLGYRAQELLSRSRRTRYMFASLTILQEKKTLTGCSESILKCCRLGPGLSAAKHRFVPTTKPYASAYYSQAAGRRGRQHLPENEHRGLLRSRYVLTLCCSYLQSFSHEVCRGPIYRNGYHSRGELCTQSDKMPALRNTYLSYV